MAVLYLPIMPDVFYVGKSYTYSINIYIIKILEYDILGNTINIYKINFIISNKII